VPYAVNAVFSSYWISINKAWFGVVINLFWAILLILILWVNIGNKGVNALGYAFLYAYSILFCFQIGLYFYTRRSRLKAIVNG
jgi:O-antigen/teichoic acid export membrane protein